MTRRRAVQKAFENILNDSCPSLFEGCACERARGHSGMHRCSAEHTDGTGENEWDDEQATEWIARMTGGGGDR